ncbi:unnamed protein product [Urochloa humidicola]
MSPSNRIRKYESGNQKNKKRQRIEELNLTKELWRDIRPPFIVLNWASYFAGTRLVSGAATECLAGSCG